MEAIYSCTQKTQNWANRDRTDSWWWCWSRWWEEKQMKACARSPHAPLIATTWPDFGLPTPNSLSSAQSLLPHAHYLEPSAQRWVDLESHRLSCSAKEKFGAWVCTMSWKKWFQKSRYQSAVHRTRKASLVLQLAATRRVKSDALSE